MSGIATGVRVNDGLSPAFAAMTQSINICLGSFAEMQAATGQAVNTTAIHQAQAAMDDLNVAAAGIDDEMAKAAAGIDEVSKSAAGIDDEMAKAAAGQDKYNKTVAAGENHAGNLMHKVMGLVGAYASINAVKGIVGISDEMTQTTARLNLMNDNLQTTQQLQQKIMDSANRSRAAYADTANAVAKMGINAAAAFNSNDELISFMEQVNKQFVIGGASATEQSNAMLQLSQAMAAGALRGEELNSILDSAPGIARSIEQSMGWASGSIKQYAGDGKVTAQIVKESMLDMADKTNEAFESIPVTWAQTGIMMQNHARDLFEPVLNQINQLAQNENAQVVFDTLTQGMANVAAGASIVFGAMVDGANWVIENWDMISPVVYGVAAAIGFYTIVVAANSIANGISTGVKIISCLASYAHAAAIRTEASKTAIATAAQYGFNTALLACPLTWIVLGIAAVIGVVAIASGAFNDFSFSVTGALGAICGGLNVVKVLFINLYQQALNKSMAMTASTMAMGENIKIAFTNSLLGVQHRFYTLAAVATGCIADIGEELSRLPFIQFDATGLRAAADSYKAKAAAADAAKGTYVDVGAAYNNAQTYTPFQSGWAGNAYKEGQNFANGVADKFKIPEMPNTPTVPTVPGSANNAAADNTAAIAGNTADTANNTAAIANSVDISNEQLKYLRDIAERDTVNRFTTAKIKVEMTNHNKIDSNLDLDGIVNNLTTSVSNAMSKAAEGVHA